MYTPYFTHSKFGLRAPQGDMYHELCATLPDHTVQDPHGHAVTLCKSRYPFRLVYWCLQIKQCMRMWKTSLSKLNCDHVCTRFEADIFLLSQNEIFVGPK